MSYSMNYKPSPLWKKLLLQNAKVKVPCLQFCLKKMNISIATIAHFEIHLSFSNIFLKHKMNIFWSTIPLYGFWLVELKSWWKYKLEKFAAASWKSILSIITGKLHWRIKEVWPPKPGICTSYSVRECVYIVITWVFKLNGCRINLPGALHGVIW